ncbi:MAG: hypothetical protein ACYDHC_09855 [Desulfuromonadaceae bacterium]
MVLVPGAADASEGTVYLNENTVFCRKELCEIKRSSTETTDMEYVSNPEQQPGEGFWSVAPGCGDISEGRVWVAVVRKS